MNLMKNLTGMAQQVGGTLSDNSPSIFAGLSILGVVTTTILGIEAGIKAEHILIDERDCREKESPNGIDPLTKKDVVKLTWKCYIPTAISGVGTIACIIASNTLHMRRYAMVSTAYSLLQTGVQKYQAKVIEQLGEKKEAKIHDEIAKDRMVEHPIEAAGRAPLETIGTGESLCYDSLSGRYFMGDMETIRQAVNSFNEKLYNHEPYLSVNDFYDLLGLKQIDTGHLIGWTTENPLRYNYSPQWASDKRPCLVMEVSPHTMPRPL